MKRNQTKETLRRLAEEEGRMALDSIRQSLTYARAAGLGPMAGIIADRHAQDARAFARAAAGYALAALSTK